jgi:hypothetical protein
MLWPALVPVPARALKVARFFLREIGGDFSLARVAPKGVDDDNGSHDMASKLSVYERTKLRIGYMC